jgi:hypothetical protein
MVVLMGGRASQGYALFQQLTVKAFLALRPHADQLVGMVQLMLDTGLPSFKGEGTIKRLRDRFALGLNERQAAEWMVGIVKNAHENVRSTAYDEFQRVSLRFYAESPLKLTPGFKIVAKWHSLQVAIVLLRSQLMHRFSKFTILVLIVYARLGDQIEVQYLYAAAQPKHFLSTIRLKPGPLPGHSCSRGTGGFASFRDPQTKSFTHPSFLAAMSRKYDCAALSV